MLLTLDLHPVFRNDRDIDRSVRSILFRAASTGADQVEIITGKGSGTLSKRVLATLAQPHLRKLYKRYQVDPHNSGRIIVQVR